MVISKKTIIFQVSRGRDPTFSRGSNFFQVGSNCLFPIKTHISCDFLRGVQAHNPPLDLLMNPLNYFFEISQEVNFQILTFTSVKISNYCKSVFCILTWNL